MFALKLIAILGSGSIAGVFFAFSTFIMKALDRIQPTQSIAAMQSINIAVINPLFMTTFLGTAVTCAFLTVNSLLKWNRLDSIYSIVGCILYLVGTFLVTMLFNVPLNEALAKVEPNSSDAANLWTDYSNNWTFWNHVRTIASLSATTAFTVAIRVS